MLIVKIGTIVKWFVDMTHNNIRILLQIKRLLICTIHNPPLYISRAIKSAPEIAIAR